MPNQLSVFGGTFAEGAASEGTFGLYQPDVVSSRTEKEYPYAASIGRVAGMMAGFIGSTSLTGGLIGLTLKAPRWLGLGLRATKWGIAILESSGGAGLKAQASYSFLKRGTGGMITTSSNFGIQNFAREFVAQMKTGDWDAYELGTKSVQGALPGAIFGAANNVTVFLSRTAQITAGGTAMSIAGAVARAADKEEINPANVLTDFITGAALSAIGSSSGKERLRRISAEQVKREQAALAIFKEIDDPKVGLGIPTSRFLIKHEPEFVAEAKARGIDIAAYEKASQAELGKALGVLKAGGLQTKGKPSYGLKSSGKEALIPVYNLFESIGWLEKGMTKSTVIGELFVGGLPKGKPPIGGGTSIWSQPKSTKLFNKQGMSVVKNITGREIDRPSQMTNEEGKLVYDTIAKLIATDMGVNPLTLKVGGGVGNAGYVRGSAEQNMFRFGLHDLVDPALKASRVKNILVQTGMEDVYASGRVIRTDMGVLGKEGVKRWTNGVETPKSYETIWDIMSLPQAKFETFVNTLKPEVRASYTALVKWRDYFYNRTNQALRYMGEPEFQSREHYIRTVIAQSEDYARKRIGGMEQIGRHTKGADLSKKKMVTSQGETISGIVWNASFLPKDAKNVEIVKDPFRAITLMMENDLKTMLLEQPARILSYRLNVLEAAGIIQKADKATAIDFFNTFLAGMPTKANIELNTSIAGALKRKKLDKVFGALTKRLMGRDMAERPYDGMNTIWGKAVVNAYLAGRPALDLRNLTQSLHWHGVTNTVAMLKAITFPVPKRAQELSMQSVSYRASIAKVAQEGEMGLTGQLEKSLMTGFQGAHSINVGQTGRASVWWDMKEMITNPKYDKHNFWTQSGKDLRKRTGNNNLLSHEEEQYYVRALEAYIPRVQFIYDKPGLPGVFQSAAKPLAKLQSFIMNYFGNYNSTLWHEMKTGKPVWAKPDENITLPLSRRLGLAKHYVGLSILVGALSRANMDFSDMVGVSFDPWKPGAAGKDEGIVKQVTSRTTLGVFNLRPSPAVTTAFAIGDAVFGQDEYTRSKGLSALKDTWILATGAVVPGGLAAKQLWRAGEEGDRSMLIFRKPYVPNTGKTVFSPNRPNTRGSSGNTRPNTR